MFSCYDLRELWAANNMCTMVCKSDAGVAEEAHGAKTGCGVGEAGRGTPASETVPWSTTREYVPRSATVSEDLRRRIVLALE